MKIAVIGYSGSGKSTLARGIGEKRALPVLHLDNVHWLPGWQERDGEEENAVVSTFLDAHPEGWVIDGNYRKMAYDRRMAEADLIVCLEFSRAVCLVRVLKRWLANRGRTRPDMGEGCDEKVDLAFIRWILRDGRRPAVRESRRALREKYPEKYILLKNQRQVNGFLGNLLEETP
ncbi:MAG: DNA topology modulation protein FlaR [Clostridia bacterium]|nr:DNA topology modulation protein FlaR [Clostridia bacterium]